MIYVFNMNLARRERSRHTTTTILLAIALRVYLVSKIEFTMQAPNYYTSTQLLYKQSTTEKEGESEEEEGESEKEGTTTRVAPND